MKQTIRSLLAYWILTLTISSAWAIEDDTGWENRGVLLTVKRGLTGQLTFSHPSQTLQAMPNQSIDSDVLVRLERTKQGSEPQQSDHLYTLRFFGTVAGDYDLSRWVVQRDGSPLSGDEALPPMAVRVVSELPPGHGTSLYEIDDPAVRAPRGYRAGLVCFALLWLMVPVAWSVLRWRSRRPEPATPPTPPETLADRLRPLVDRASQGQLTVDEQSRLELLLYVFWQKRLGLPASMAKALPIMRHHVEAGGLLRALEAWIHGDASQSDEEASVATTRQTLSPATMDALLAPYHASMQLDDLQANAEVWENRSLPTESGKIGEAV